MGVRESVTPWTLNVIFFRTRLTWIEQKMLSRWYRVWWGRKFWRGKDRFFKYWRSHTNNPSILSIFGSLCNHAIFNCLTYRHAITRDTHPVEMCHSRQDLFCGRGKWWLKYVMRLLEAKKYFPSLKACETISAISLSFPATWSGVTLDALRAWMQILSMRSRVPAAINTDNLFF